ncbi:DUF1800 domain-containing protein [Mycolicibacterium moriokaense]|uniref:Uncharacterized protein DUF1800 n=1 Tax=Mycolicibacterium moriokaense TaxID=39691 RepID=A0A318H613_9MYCO|nr:DUF1800 domain-containing protein [Mycolicibacterium moriokaense]PXW99131.1 uncharacterized protein DUF1800 [Mycolicibacterium moriokaense]
MSQSAQWIAAARLLRRTGFGAVGSRIDALAGQDWSQFLDGVLGSDPDADPGARATPMPILAPHAAPSDRASQADIDAYGQLLYDEMSQLAGWWLRRMAAVQQPIHEKLTLVWHDHFATSADKVSMGAWMAAQNQKLRTLKLGDFSDLAYAMLVDAAMLVWLDGESNTAKAPNENLSREFMELFTLGHANGYSEADVKEGARALSGWKIDMSNGSTRQVDDLHDPGAKTVLGLTDTLDAADFCKVVLAQPQSAAFVATRLWRRLASDSEPPPETLGRLVAAYGPNRDLKALTKAVLMDPAFTDRATTLVTTPVEWMIGAFRSLGVPLDRADLIREVGVALSTLGQLPFYPPDVGGWPRGRAWLSTGSSSVRVWATTKLAEIADLSTVEHAATNDRIDAVGYMIGVGAWSDSTARVLKPLSGNPQHLVAAAINTPEYLTS